MKQIGYRQSALIKEAIIKNSSEMDRKWAYDRDEFLNSSEAGVCLRQLWFLKRGNAKKEAKKMLKNFSGTMKRGCLLYTSPSPRDS